MCGSSSSSTKSKSTRNTDNSRTDNRMAASDQAVVADGRARINVERADARALVKTAGMAGDTLEDTARLATKANETQARIAKDGIGEASELVSDTLRRGFNEVSGWRQFVGEAYEGAVDLTEGANDRVEALARSTSTDDNTEVAQNLIKLGIPAAALVAGAYFLGR